MKHFVSLYTLLFTCSLISCKKIPIEQPCDSDAHSTKKFEVSDMCSPKIMSYNFGVEHLLISDQTSTLSNLKMNGMMIQIESHNCQDLDNYYNDCLVKSGEFNIYNIFTTISLNNLQASSRQLVTIERIYKKIQSNDTQLLVLFEGEKHNPKLKPFILQIADIAKKYNKNLVIYPHAGLAIETSEEALSFIKTINKDNIFLSIHLCHELSAGNGNRIEQVVQKVSPYIKAVSISGASLNEKEDNNLPEWYWGIKPLSMGTYKYSTFYNALYKANYQGPIAIHTWGIFNNFNLTIDNHLLQSKNIIDNMSKQICP